LVGRRARLLRCRAACGRDRESERGGDTAAGRHAGDPKPARRCIQKTDRSTKDVALRRLSVMRDVLHVLDAPRFGTRRSGSKPLTSEERYRQMLGLPLAAACPPFQAAGPRFLSPVRFCCILFRQLSTNIDPVLFRLCCKDSFTSGHLARWRDK
jgi:hypothetical protein